MPREMEGIVEEIEGLVREAWERVGWRIMSDPAEVERRRQRMEGKTLSRVPREWCLALRANDRRIPVGAMRVEEEKESPKSETRNLKEARNPNDEREAGCATSNIGAREWSYPLGKGREAHGEMSVRAIARGLGVGYWRVHWVVRKWRERRRGGRNAERGTRNAE